MTVLISYGAPRVNTRGTLNPSAESAEAGKTLLRSVPACRQAGLTAELLRKRTNPSSGGGGSVQRIHPRLPSRGLLRRRINPAHICRGAPCPPKNAARFVRTDSASIVANGRPNEKIVGGHKARPYFLSTNVTACPSASLK